MKTLAAAIYLLLLPIFLVWRLTRRDALQLRRLKPAASYWLVRETVPTVQSYFLETSVAEGRRAHREGADDWTDAGVARWLVPPLLKLARLFAPSRSATQHAVSAADRERSIPDEVYTLW